MSFTLIDNIQGGSGLYKGELVDSAALIALGESTLTDAFSYFIDGGLYVWDADAASGDFEPSDKVNPGVDPGYWVATGGEGLYKGELDSGVELVAIPIADLDDAYSYYIDGVLYVWDADAIGGAFEPTDKPGIGPGYWVATAGSSPLYLGSIATEVALSNLPFADLDEPYMYYIEPCLYIWDANAASEFSGGAASGYIYPVDKPDLNTAAEGLGAWVNQCRPLDPTLPVTTCYTRPTNLDQPINISASTATGMGYVTEKLWSNTNFVDAGSDVSGNADPSFGPLVVTDQDGLPTVNAEHGTVNANNLTYNETGGRGQFFTYEGFIYIPIKNPDTAAGKTVTKFEIYDAYTNLAVSDYQQLWIAHDASGNYSLARKDLKLKIDQPVPASLPTYEFDISQAGQWVRFYACLSDLANNSQMNWKFRLTYADGTIANNVATPDFTCNLPLPQFHATWDLETVSKVYDPGAGTTVWSPSDAENDVALNQQIQCSDIPITFNSFVDGNTVKITNVFGGTAPYGYSIDRGLTFQSSPIFTLTDKIGSILPRVRDANFLESSQYAASAYRDFQESTFNINIAGAVADATSHVDPSGGGSGWTTTHTGLLDGTHFIKRTSSTIIQARGVTDSTLTTDAIDVSLVDGWVIPQIDVRDYGSPDVGVNQFDYEYRIDGGAWVTMITCDGQTDVTGQVQFSDYYFEEGVDVTAASTIQYRLAFRGDGDSTDGYSVYTMTHNTQNP